MIASISSCGKFSMLSVNITTDLEGDEPAAKAFSPLINESAISIFGKGPAVLFLSEFSVNWTFELSLACEPNNKGPMLEEKK